MPAFWSSSSSPYQPVAQDEKLSEAGSASDLLAERTERRSEKWLGRVVVCIATANVLIALWTLIATRDISKIRIPLSGADIASLPRPDPYFGLN